MQKAKWRDSVPDYLANLKPHLRECPGAFPEPLTSREIDGALAGLAPVVKLLTRFVDSQFDTPEFRDAKIAVLTKAALTADCEQERATIEELKLNAEAAYNPDDPRNHAGLFQSVMEIAHDIAQEDYHGHLSEEHLLRLVVVALLGLAAIKQDTSMIPAELIRIIHSTVYGAGVEQKSGGSSNG